MSDGVVVWFTGLPASGKSTLARRVQERLAGRLAVLLDGDEVRAALVPSPGYDEASRDDFYATLARLGALLARQGSTVLVAATAHERRYRAAARDLAPRFLEVYVEASVDDCARRDPKGLYARARSGDAASLPGAGARYEPPEAPEVRATGGWDERAVAEILVRLDAPAGAGPMRERRDLGTDR